MRRRALRGFLAVTATAAALGLLAVGCGSSESGSGDTPATAPPGGAASTDADITVPVSGAPKPGGKLVYGLEAETDGFNPTSSRWAVSGMDVANAVYDPLMAYNADGVATPYLLESSTHNEDYTVWTGKLRPGIKFHNGKPLNAEVLKELTLAHMNSPLTGAAAEPIKEPVVVDDLTIQTVMKRPWVAYPNILTGQGGMVPDPAIFQPGSELGKKPVGTGPFVFKEWSPNNKFVATKNTDYWRKDGSGNPLPYLDEVEFRPVPDPQSRVAALKDGSLNAMHTSSAKQIAELKAEAEAGQIQLYIDRGPAEKSEVLLNTAKAPLDDVRVRQALAYATNVEQVAEINGTDPSLIVDGPFAKTSPWYAESGYPKYDPEKARQLIDEVEAEKGPLKITLGTTPAAENQNITQAIGAQWQSVGIDVQQRDYDQATFIVNVVTGDYDTVLWRQYGEPDPDSDYIWWHSSTAKPAPQLSLNMTRNKNAKIDEGMDTGRATPDETARKKAYALVQEGMGESVPYVWLYSVPWVVAADNTVRDITNGPLPDGQQSMPMVNGAHRLTQAWLAQ